MPAVHRHGDLVERHAPRAGEQRVVGHDAARSCASSACVNSASASRGVPRSRSTCAVGLADISVAADRSAMRRRDARADVGDARARHRAPSGACSASQVSCRSLRASSFIVAHVPISPAPATISRDLHPRRERVRDGERVRTAARVAEHREPLDRRARRRARRARPRSRPPRSSGPGRSARCPVGRARSRAGPRSRAGASVQSKPAPHAGVPCSANTGEPFGSPYSYTLTARPFVVAHDARPHGRRRRERHERNAHVVNDRTSSRNPDLTGRVFDP